MKPFEAFESTYVVLARDHVDTDQIIPARYLKTTTKTGLGEHCFQDWRYDDSGEPNPSFPLNAPEARQAQVLVAGENFGCGSSREHAPWALADYGIRALVAPSYADIFFNNCFKNGVLPIVLGDSEVSRLFDATLAFPGFSLTVDLERQTVATRDGSMSFGFAVEPFRKKCLLEGLDDIGLTLLHADQIRAFEARRLAEQPWIA